jgi:hypothetical protein
MSNEQYLKEALHNLEITLGKLERHFPLNALTKLYSNYQKLIGIFIGPSNYAISIFIGLMHFWLYILYRLG